MIKIAILAAMAAIFVSLPAQADSLRDGFPICVSEKLLDQMYEAILQKDMPGMDYLFDHGCFLTKQGVQVSILDRSNWGARAHIRVYSDKGAVEAWTSMGALESYQP